MTTRTRARILLFALAVVALVGVQVRPRSQALSPVTTPLQQFGATVGDDYFLATYTQLEAYWHVLDRESDRMTLVDIGRTEEGRTQWMAVVSAPENVAQLDRYREISQRLSLAEGLTEQEAQALASEGKAIVWIDGGLHASEVLGAQQLIEMTYQLVSRSDPETTRLLQDTIVLLAHANPDGHELVANWYMRDREPTQRTLAGLPRLYQKYVGHDNNRDFYLSSQAETRNINRVLYQQWFPQIVYNHHQSGPAGTVMFAPPFRDPFNYLFDPLIPTSIDLVGGAMHARFAAEGKAGVTMRTGSPYSTWWNGGLRTTAYFHNQIGLLTETIGEPTPITIPFVADKQVPSGDLPYPIAPQTWHFRQSVDYSISANRAVLDVASRYRERLLLNAYRMGRNSIERGSRDTWTASPRRLGRLQEQYGRGGQVPARVYEAELRDPSLRDPRGYILPSDQPDAPTATKFVQALLSAGIAVHRATSDFTVAGKRYPAGSYVVKTAQAFRPHVLDMFEPQDHPDDIPYPGAPPTQPYDNTGWTLAFQMGVKFDRVLDAFDGPFERVTTATPDAGRMSSGAGAAGFLVGHQQNDAFVAVNRLLKAGQRVMWPTDRSVTGLAPGSATGPNTSGTGAMYVPATATALPVLEEATRLGLSFTGVPAAPPGPMLELKPVRIGLWDRYGGSTSSGWLRWLLERYEFPFEVVYSPAIDAGDLNRRFDVLILPGDAVPLNATSSTAEGLPIERVPPQFAKTVGQLTWGRSVPALKQFVQNGGTLIAFGGATDIAASLGVPVRDALVDGSEGATRPLPMDKYYVPGSVLRVSVDNTVPLGYGFESQVDVFFDNSPVFRVPSQSARAARRVAWFADAAPLRSGWAWGQKYLANGVTVVDATVGRGHVVLFGPDVTYRAQSHGTFKFLFNAIYYPHATPTR
jgi:hypothetical protein